MFQSSPSPKAGSYMSYKITYSQFVKFQSSPSPKAGSYESFESVFNKVTVSILSQPEGRELRYIHIIPAIKTYEFQSSPSPKAGSYI